MNCPRRRAARLRLKTSSRLGLRPRLALPRRLPGGIVLLHHPETLGEVEAAEGAGEAAEAVAVAGADQQVVVVAHMFGLPGEVEGFSTNQLDPVQPAEADGRRLGRLAFDPDRPLAALRRVVDPFDQVPGEVAPLNRLAD